MNKNKIRSNINLIPIILLVGFVPILVHQFIYNTNLSQFDWYPNEAETKIDFFFAYKMISIILIAIVMICILGYRFIVKKKELCFENSFYFLFFYGLFVIMSALFSNYKYWVIHGTYELFEPVWVVLAYLISCFYIYQYLTNEYQLKQILKWSGFGVLIVTLIGLFQLLGFDFFKSTLGKHLIINPSQWNNLDQINFQVGNHVSYSTLYNQNFLSLYFGLIIPLIFCLIFACSKIWQRIILSSVEIACIICLVGAQSDSGWMALILGTVIVVLTLLSRKKKTFFIAVVLLVVGACGSSIFLANTTIGKQIKTTIVGSYHMKDLYELWGFDTNEDSVQLNIQGNILNLSYDVDENNTMAISCWDNKNTPLELLLINQDRSIYSINDQRFSDINIEPVWYGNDTLAIAAIIQDQTWGFVNCGADGYYYYNPANKLVKYHNINSSEFFNEDTFSGRGHIWNLTIPLLKKHIFIGAGANAFLLDYPQDDYIFGAYVSGPNTYDVKAHCWYLQQWVETGLVGTLSLIIFLAWYIVKSIQIYRCADFKNKLNFVGLGFFYGIIVYLIVAVANDSNVCTAPIFWCALGLGMAVNRIITDQSIENMSPKINETMKKSL